MADTAAILEEVPTWINVLSTADDDTERKEAATKIRRALSLERSPPISELIEAGAVPPLMAVVADHESHEPQLVHECAWALTNIASGTTDHTRVVVEAGAVPAFAQLLAHASSDIAEQAAWALGNIAGDSTTMRDLVISSGALTKLCELIVASPRITVLRNGTWALGNLFRGKPQPPLTAVAPALPVLARLIYTSDDEALADAMWALSYASDGPNERIQAVLECGCVRRMVECLMHSNASVITPSLRAVGNIVTGDDAQTQAVLNCGALPALVALLANPKKGIRKETCWALSNIAAGSSAQIQAMIDASAYPPLFEIMRRDAHDVVKEALWALSNSTEGGSKDQIQYLLDNGILPTLVSALQVPDPRLCLVSLDGVKNVLNTARELGVLNVAVEQLESCGGLDKIEMLQQHENVEVYERCVRLLSEFFEAEEDEDAPAAAAETATPADAPATVEAVATALSTFTLAAPASPVAPPPVPEWTAPPRQNNDDEGDADAGPEEAVEPAEAEDGRAASDDDDDGGGLGGEGDFVF